MGSPKQIRSRTAARKELSSFRAAAARERRRAGWPHWTLVVTSAVTLLVATLSAVVSVTGAQSSADEVREQESRGKKATLYAAYLTAVRAAATETDKIEGAIGDDLEALKENPPNTTQHLAALNALIKASGPLNSASVEFYKQGDQVFVYGSDAAYQIHEELARVFDRQVDLVATFVPSSGLVIGLVEGVVRQSLSVDRTAIAALITRFQLVFCAEVSPTPRDGCK